MSSGSKREERPGLYVLDEPTRILLVDDDPILGEFAQVYLSAPEVEVEVVLDAEAGWALLAEREFDIALIDIEMPGLDGFALVERIRGNERLQHLPVIMVTGREDIASIDRAYDIGATSFVTKPVNWRQLSHQVRYVIRASRIEATARAACERAEHASRLKSNMLALLQHELRTPLNSILGFAELMLKEPHGALGHDYRDYAEHIAASGRELLATAVELMHSARLLSGEIEFREDEYTFGRLVAEAVTAVGTGEGRPEIKVDMPPRCQEAQLTCDRREILSLLRHLLVNAQTHGAGNAAPEITVSEGADQRLTLSVSDHGPGIAAERLAFCLEMFGQAEDVLTRSTGGLGLGLPLARRIAEMHGADFEISCRPGAGTTVSIVFPAERLRWPDAATIKAA